MAATKEMLSNVIAEFIEKRSALKLEALEKAQVKALAALEEGSEAWRDLKAQQKQKTHEESVKFKPEVWLEHAASRAKQISLTTHSPKYTHSDAKGNGILVTPPGDAQPDYLITEAISEPTLDVIGNAAALDIAGLLKLEINGKALHHYLAEDDVSPLLPFAESEQQALSWLADFKQALSPASLSSHTLAKQLYFPVGESYHLISPLFASSLYQEVHEKIEWTMFSKEQKQAREARANKQYSDTFIVSIPEIAVQSFGGAQPQNISQLNSKSIRNGKAYLLSCAPPTWQSQERLPGKSVEGFWQLFAERVGRKVAFLKFYLSKRAKQPSTKAMRDIRADLIDELIDQLFATAAEIQNLRHRAGWSKSSGIPMAEQYWLDPYRGLNSESHEDKAFQQVRQSNEWQADVAKRFGQWLNKRLRAGDKLNVGDAEYNEWRRLVQKKLARLAKDMEDFS